MGNFAQEAVEKIRHQVGKDEVILGLSGGVDSSVTAALIHRAIGDQLTCVFVDNGLLRLHEREQVAQTFRDNMGMKLIVVDASDRFMDALAGVTDPEAKRKIIGRLFVEVFQEEAENFRTLSGLLKAPFILTSLNPTVLRLRRLRRLSLTITSAAYPIHCI